MSKITPCLWFDKEAEEAASFYVSVFGGDSKILSVSRYPEGSNGEPGSAMVVEFVIGGQEMQGLNGGPIFKPNEAVSLSVSTDGQEETDRFWEALSEGGSKSQCGWLKDRWGFSWQIVPKQMGEIMSDPEKAKRAMPAMMQMTKIDIAALERAAKGE